MVKYELMVFNDWVAEICFIEKKIKELLLRALNEVDIDISYLGWHWCSSYKNVSENCRISSCLQVPDSGMEHSFLKLLAIKRRERRGGKRT